MQEIQLNLIRCQKLPVHQQSAAHAGVCCFHAAPCMSVPRHAQRVCHCALPWQHTYCNAGQGQMQHLTHTDAYLITVVLPWCCTQYAYASPATNRSVPVSLCRASFTGASSAVSPSDTFRSSSSRDVRQWAGSCCKIGPPALLQLLNDSSCS